MNVDDVKRFYSIKKSVELARVLSVSEVTIVNWKNNGIPYGQQCIFYYESKHKLKPSRNKRNFKEFKNVI